MITGQAWRVHSATRRTIVDPSMGCPWRQKAGGAGRRCCAAVKPWRNSFGSAAALAWICRRRRGVIALGANRSAVAFRGAERTRKCPILRAGSDRPDGGPDALTLLDDGNLA